MRILGATQRLFVMVDGGGKQSKWWLFLMYVVAFLSIYILAVLALRLTLINNADNLAH